MERLVGPGRHACDDEDELEGSRREPVTQGGDGRVVVDVCRLDHERLAAEAYQVGRRCALGCRDVPAALQQRLDQTEAEPARGTDDQRVLQRHGVSRQVRVLNPRFEPTTSRVGSPAVS